MKKASFHHTMITHHSDGSHTVEHHPHMKSASKSGAFMEQSEPTSYSAPNTKELMSKMSQHLQGDGAAVDHAVKTEADVDAVDDGRDES